jgi:hypothetical protein
MHIFIFVGKCLVMPSMTAYFAIGFIMHCIFFVEQNNICDLVLKKAVQTI